MHRRRGEYVRNGPPPEDDSSTNPPSQLDQSGMVVEQVFFGEKAEIPQRPSSDSSPYKVEWDDDEYDDRDVSSLDEEEDDREEEDDDEDKDADSADL